MSQPFLAEIKAVGFNFPPRGYAACKGQLMSISQNSAVFSLLGTNFGGDGIQTFGLPNLQGRTAIGQGQSGGTSNYVLGQTGGVEAVSLNLQQLPQHTHGATTTVTPTSTLSATTTINALGAPTSRSIGPAGNLMTTGSAVVSGTAVAVQMYAAPGNGNPVTLAPGAATTTLAGDIIATAQTTVQPAGSSLPVEIIQPYVAVNYIIAIQGIFPSRN